MGRAAAAAAAAAAVVVVDVVRCVGEFLLDEALRPP